MNSNYFSYIRVSTLKQGQTGTSLDEQRAAINRYAERQGFSITREFEEKETAAKLGRPIFEVMLKGLQKGEARGVIIHKIDRSARNLKDWANLGELIDRGIEVHFANESLDLQSRGGRLSADIQAVVASDYIRNLREEVKKGFYGRIKQGLYPRPAPIGYRDGGQGQVKVPDPIMAPLIRQMFELYATGHYNLNALRVQMHELGLRTVRGGKLTRNAIAGCLHNPFYIGLIHIKVKGELYPGAHAPLIPKPLFDKVQAVISGKAVKTTNKHCLLFRKLLRCGACRYGLIGERQKGHIYYRCQTKNCPEKTIREEIVEAYLLETLQKIQFNDTETLFFKQKVKVMYQTAHSYLEAQQKAVQLQMEQIKNRLSKLTDAYLDGTIEESIYLEKKNAYLLEEQAAKENLNVLNQKQPHIMRQVEEFLELANNAYLSYKLATPEEKRELVKITTSNLSIKNKVVLVTLNNPFQIVADRNKNTYGAPSRATPRTFDKIFASLVEFYSLAENSSSVCKESLKIARMRK